MEIGGFQLLIAPIRNDLALLNKAVTIMWEEQQRNSERLERLEYLVEKLAIAKGGEMEEEEEGRKRARIIRCHKCEREIRDDK